MRDKKPIQLYFLTSSFIPLFLILIAWTYYSYTMFIKAAGWGSSTEVVVSFISLNYFIFLLGSLIWSGIAILLLILMWGLIKKCRWAWTTAVITTTLGLVFLPLMLISMMVTLLKHQTSFSILGIITCTLAILTDICIVFLLTRPVTKQYFSAKQMQ